MITNFDYFKTESKFSAFADVAISAEKIIVIDPESSIINSRRGHGICHKVDVFGGQ